MGGLKREDGVRPVSRGVGKPQHLVGRLALQHRVDERGPEDVSGAGRVDGAHRDCRFVNQLVAGTPAGRASVAARMAAS